MGLIIIPEEILQYPKRDGQMVKSLTASLVSREEEERHQRNLNEDEQLKNQIAEWTCSRPCHVSHLHRLRLHATHQVNTPETRPTAKVSSHSNFP
ncbi:hypothetical protein RRG08_012836 [Elysia crispata]|uniref:Uncharacterized protein n=1 Tax=Elysia crispata TaxID=231223 RepID=A0AAE1ECD5_9GAST|nr:hypothetical protein RRG08_012836 [Elysia crispata]